MSRTPTTSSAPPRRVRCPDWAQPFRSLAVAWSRCAEPVHLLQLLEEAVPSLETGRRVGRAFRALTRATVSAVALQDPDSLAAEIAPLVDGVLDDETTTLQRAAAAEAEIDHRIRLYVDRPPRQLAEWLRQGSVRSDDGSMTVNPEAREWLAGAVHAARALECAVLAITRSPTVALHSWFGYAGGHAPPGGTLRRDLCDRIRAEFPSPPAGVEEPRPPEGWTGMQGGAS